jgi:feruloyl esterase
MKSWSWFAGALLIGLGVAPPAHAQQPCEALANLKLPYTTITSAKMVPEGPLAPPTTAVAPTGRGAGGGGGRGNAPVVPARCEVRGIIKPSGDSNIGFAVWMPPAATWNGKYRQNGNGGWAGNIGLAAMIDPLQRGYATAATDDGHEGDAIRDASWAVGHPERLVDFGYRAVHETAVQAKAIIRAFYGKDSSRNYFFGCSDGGREALMEAERYPEDFAGIVAAAPAWDWSHLFTSFVWNEQALMKAPGSNLSSKIEAIQKASLAACDEKDGAKDGLVEDPRQCTFDPRVIQCKGAEGPDCLTAAQVEALRKVYAGPKNSRGDQIFPGVPLGAEGAPGTWASWIAPADPTQSLQSGLGNSYYGQAVFENPKWDFRTLNFDGDVRYGDAKVGSLLNSSSPDLRSFRANGGRLIQYHGWGDPAISALSSIAYYENVQKFLTSVPDGRSDASKPTTDFYRLFMVPGMGHCQGGAGPNRFGNGAAVSPATANDPERDVFAALERWVEKGTAPDHFIGQGVSAEDRTKTLTRPICQYPNVARYKGTGDLNDAANFSCVAPVKR